MPKRQRINFERVNELRHKNFGTNFEKISLTSAQVINKSWASSHVTILHGGEVNMPTKLGAESNIWCRSPQLGDEFRSVPKLLVTKIDSPITKRDDAKISIVIFFHFQKSVSSPSRFTSVLILLVPVRSCPSFFCFLLSWSGYITSHLFEDWPALVCPSCFFIRFQRILILTPLKVNSYGKII